MRMTFYEYKAIDAVNWSKLKAMSRSPLHFRESMVAPRVDSDGMRLGRAGHTAVLEPDQFQATYAIWDGGRRYGRDWEAFKTAAGDKDILTVDQAAAAHRIGRAVREHPAASKYLAWPHSVEESIVWTDPATEIKCKARLDLIGLAIVDLKTSKEIGSRHFASTVAKFGYHKQLAFYRRGYKSVTQRELPCVLIAVESSAPFDVAVYEMNEDALFAGDEEVSELLLKLKTCRDTGKWPGQYPEPVELHLPAWAFGDSGSDTDALDGLSWPEEEAA